MRPTAVTGMTACPARDAEELKRLRREDEELKRTNEI
jgi:hypothetical protein